MLHANTLRSRTGFTLVELLIAIVMLSIIMAATISLFSSQSANFRKGTSNYDLMQNARGVMEVTERIIRTMGSGTSGDQPMLVYGDNEVLAFNADYAEADTTDMRWATNFNPDMTETETTAWLLDDAGAIPNSSFSYPPQTYRVGSDLRVSPAETYIFYFVPDPSTARSDDYMLMQRINAGQAEIVGRSILHHPNGKPFFEYHLERETSGLPTIITASGALLPLVNRPLSTATNSADSASFSRPDSVRTIRLHYTVSNGKSGTDERKRDVTASIALPNNGVPLPSICGRAPFGPASITAANVAPAGSGRVNLTWTRSSDQDGGEKDVLQYLVYRKSVTATQWTDPLAVIRATHGTASYSMEIAGNLPDSNYTFGISAQDCTPNTSSATQVNIHVTATPP